MTLVVFDLIIIHNIFEITLTLTHKANLPNDIDFIFQKMKEHIHYTPMVILLFDDEMSRIRATQTSDLKDVNRCFVLPINELMFMKAVDGIITHSKKESASPSSTTMTALPKFVGIGFAISTGGPKTIFDVIAKIPRDFEPPIFIVQHGPNWLLEDYVDKFQTRYRKASMLAKNGQIIQPNTIYVAPDKLHMVINKDDFTLRLIDTEKECFVKPSADPLFRSIARAFGQYSLGVVMTGLGSDGTKGSLHIEAAGGAILVEDPKTAIAQSMPNALIKSGCNAIVLKANMMGEAIIKTALKITAALNKAKKK
jgi:two-component system chemotaxis response regulator CheB